MKRINKLIPYAFFGVVFLTFFFSFVFDISVFSAVINLFQSFKDSWSSVIGYFLEVFLCVALVVFSVLLILKIRKTKEDKSLYFFKANCFLMMLYSSVYALVQLLNAIGGAAMTSMNIIAMLLLIGGIVFFALATFLNKNRRAFAGLGYFLLFTCFVYQASLGITGFLVTTSVFSFIMVILGLLHVVTYDFDLVNLRQYLTSKAQDLMNEEVPVVEEPVAEDEVVIAVPNVEKETEVEEIVEEEPASEEPNKEE